MPKNYPIKPDPVKMRELEKNGERKAVRELFDAIYRIEKQHNNRGIVYERDPDGNYHAIHRRSQ